MGYRLSVIAAAATALLSAPPAGAQSMYPTATTLTAYQPKWSGCKRIWIEEYCPPQYVSVITSAGQARISISDVCAPETVWYQPWGNATPHDTPAQWVDQTGALPTVAAGFCFEVSPYADQIAVTPTGGVCAAYDGDYWTRSQPSAAMTIARDGDAILIITGCQAASALTANGTLYQSRFGGVALTFADGYQFADYYHGGYIYAITDDRIGYAGVYGEVFDSMTNTDHYLFTVDILENGATAPAITIYQGD